MAVQNELREVSWPESLRETSPRERRWKNEVQFFDRRSEKLLAELVATPEIVQQRYLRAPRHWYTKEFRFRLLGDLKGKRVLDVGCGDGFNSVLLAKAGAEVTGIDLSPGLIAVARRRAELDGVSHRMTLLCGPLESLELPLREYDVIWGDGILHHVIDDLEPVLAKLSRVGKPGALAMFNEPVVLSRALRMLRQRLPIHSDATPDERPLQREELELLERYLPDIRWRQFYMLGRLADRVLGGRYEDASAARRLACDALHIADYALLSAPPLHPLGGLRVLWGHFAALGV